MVRSGLSDSCVVRAVAVVTVVIDCYKELCQTSATLRIGGA